MEQLDAQEVARLKELLRRTGEFIAYFELADSKMMAWRQSIEQNMNTQRELFHQQLSALQQELSTLQNLLTQAGLMHFRQAADTALEQGRQHLQHMQKTEQAVLQHHSDYQAQLAQLCEESRQYIMQYTSTALDKISHKLAQYDSQQFHRLTIDSCEQVEKSAQDAILTSSKLLRKFHWRTLALTILVSMITAFAMGLYISDEYPWEIHQHAMSERNAGKLLMNSWARLTHDERDKILSTQALQ